jgi:hypothetical protein
MIDLNIFISKTLFILFILKLSKEILDHNIHIIFFFFKKKKRKNIKKMKH